MDLTTFLKDRSGANILNCGNYGDGKTTFIAGALNSGFKGLGVMTPQNARVLSSHLTEEGKKNLIDIVDLTEQLVVTPFEPKSDKDVGIRGAPVISMRVEGSIPTVYSTLIRNASRWWINFFKKQGFTPYNELDESYFIFFDDVSALSDDVFSACKVHAMYEQGLLGKPITDVQNMKLVGATQTKVMTLLSGYLAVPKRRHHVILNAHLKQRNVSISNTLTTNEIVEATATKSRSSFGTTVKTAELFPVVCGDALSANFGRNFDWIIQSIRNGNEEPRVYFRAPSNTHNFNIRAPMIEGMKESLPASEAAKYLFTEHLKLFGK